jgi:hypothetical protein
MNERQRELLGQIQAAFAGVELGDGVRLHETVVIDLYARGASSGADRGREA